MWGNEYNIKIQPFNRSRSSSRNRSGGRSTSQPLKQGSTSARPQAFFDRTLGRSLRTLALSILGLSLVGYLSVEVFNRYIRQYQELNTVEKVVADLSDDSCAHQLGKYALQRTQELVIYNDSLPSLSYPNGDVSMETGMAVDLLIRAYRSTGFDFQKAIHEDILKHFDEYPKLWDLQGPNYSVDHRRVENILHYMETYGEVIPADAEESDLRVGDIVAWRLASAKLHVGIIVPVKQSENHEQFWVVHNFGQGPVWANDLKRFSVECYYRFDPTSESL